MGSVRKESPPLTHAENEQFLRILREVRQTYGEWLGHEAPEKVEVVFDGVSVEAEDHAARRTLPTLPNAFLNGAQAIVGSLSTCAAKKRTIKIINEVSGTIRPSRMTLVLGAPGSGKTTFLRALAGKLDSSLKLDGKVLYNGKTSSSTPHNLCAYISQHDLHHAEMTVRESINFSSSLLGTDNEFEILRRAIERDMDTRTNGVYRELFSKATNPGEGNNLKTNYIIKILGLSECADTIVGDALRRGISGGQKKRTTIGEMLVGRARCFFMDDVSTGLDSSTTFDIVKFFQQMAYLMDATMVISLLQPAQETFELFDDIILLCEGQIVYHGPRHNVVGFFDTIGFTCPSRKNVADFLQEVTSKMDQQQYWTGDEREYQYHSIGSFVKCFKAYNIPTVLEDEQCHKYGKQQGNTFQCTKWYIFKTCFLREVLLLKRNYPLHIFKAVQIIVLAFVLATLFFRTEMKHSDVFDGNKYMGSLFMGIAVVNFNGMTEQAMTVKRLPTFYKQRDLLGLPGWAILCAIFLINVPMSLMETGLWTCSTYYAIGYAPPPIRFFQHLLVLFAMHQMALSLYRLIASIARTQVMTSMISTEVLIAILILGGFVISKDDLQPWLRWGCWASPFTYSLNAIALNEFLDKRWATDFHYQNVNTTGEAVLKTRGLITEWHWYWVCVGVLFGFSLIFNVATIFAFKFLNYPQEHHFKIKAREVQDIDYKDQTVGSLNTADQCNLPFQPLSLVFSQINYFVDMPREMRKNGITEKRLQVLRDVSGAFRPGVLTALMGITGAGKTTLLDVLAGRKTGGYIEGTVSISGYPKKQDTFSRISGYCEQTDIHTPYLTVYESLQFSAYLRLPSEVDSHKRDIFVEEVMGLIELTDLRSAMVGIPGINGLSAEQRKRLTIAVELVASPSIIFMDEPTTGLDARAAAIVMRTVRNTVNTGRTVVCTIHQPSIEIFESFDELLLMKRGGQLIYSGSLGPLSSSLIKYFEAIPGVPNIKDGQNPAAWVLDISSESMEYEIGVDYSEIYQNSSLHKENMALVDDLSNPTPDQKDLYFQERYWPNFKSQCVACLWKQHCSFWKNPELNVTRFLSTFGVSITFGMVFWQIGLTIKKEQDVFNILGTAYTSALFLGYVSCSMLQPIIATERIVSYREKASGMYSSMAYVIAQVAIEIPYMLIQVFVFSAIVYPMVGFQLTITKFSWFVLYMILSFIDFTLYGMMVVALTPNEEIAMVLSFFIFMLWNVFSGFVVPRKMIPSWWRWMYWANPAAWTIYGLMLSQLGDHMELIRVPGQPDQPVSEFLKEYLGLEADHIALVTTLHIALSILFGFVFCLGIKYLKFQRR